LGALRKPQSKTLGEALDGLVRELGLQGKLREYDAVLRWEEAVGPHIAKVATANKIQHGILTVQVSNSTWRYELTMRKQEMIGKLNALIGEGVVKDVRFV
jgi:predicted nucleic acid-binding Zn ribbon protein